MTDKRPAAHRPESWDAKMPSGAPLITDAQFEKLLANAPRSPAEAADHDPVPVVKIFLPHVRWLLAWIYPDDPNRAYAVVKYGKDKPQQGDVLLSDIVRSRLGPLMPERDKYIKLNKPFSFYLSDSDWYN